jgi:hypothetical protein
MNNPMRGKPVQQTNPLVEVIRRGYSKPTPGGMNPERRYGTQARPPQRKPGPRRPSAGGFLQNYLDSISTGVESLGRGIGRTAAVVVPPASVIAGASNRLNLQSPSQNRGKFLQRVYADQEMPAGDMPMIRLFTGKQSPFAKTHGAGFDRAMSEFQRTHKWARNPKNKTDVEFAVNYLLSKKHKRYYNP